MYEFIRGINWRLAALVLVLLGGLLFWFFGRRGYRALEAVPAQSALVLTFSDANQLRAMFPRDAAGLAGLAVFQVCRTDAEQALTLFRTNADLIQNRPFAAAFSLHPNDSLHPLFALDAGRRTDLARLLAPSGDSVRVTTSVFKGHTLYTVHRTGQAPVVAAARRNIVLISRFSYLVEDALLQLDKRNPWWQQQANRTDAPFRVILRPEILAERCRAFAAPDWGYLPDWLAAKAQSVVAGYDGKQWSVSVCTPKTGHDAAPAQMPRHNIATVLPDNTTLLAWVGTGRAEALSAFAGAEGDADFQHFVASWAGKEAAYALLEPYSPGMREDQFWVCAIRDEALARKRLDEYGERTGLLRRYEYQTFEVRQFLSRSLLEPLVHARRQDFQNPVCVLLDGYAVFAAGPSALELWIDKYVVSQTLANFPDYLLLAKDLPEQGSHSLYVNAAHVELLLKQVLSPGFCAENTSEIAQVQHSGLYGLDLQRRRPGEWSGVLAHRPGTAPASAASILWKTPLSSAAIGRPGIVPIAGADNEAAILIQDEQLYLYRLSPGGNIVWRKQLDQPIVSAVQGIDFYGNGGTCYLFNTADALWIIDDEGRELVGYPLRLQSPATNGVTAVDFDDDRRYSLFVACANGNLYGFDQYGRPLPGWNPKNGVGRVKHPLVHFKKETKDYLAVLSLEGQLSVFNRSGDPHFAQVQFEGNFFISPPQFDMAPESSRIVCMNAAGRAYICNLSGQTFQLETGGKSKAGHGLVLDELFGDERLDYAVLSGNVLALSGYEGKSFQKKSVHTFSAPQDTLFGAGHRGWIGSLDRTRRQFFLINGAGRVHPGFPLAGTTPFVLRRLPAGHTGYMLVVGNGAGVYAYKVSG
ncbi:MAG: DUF3352 domain-containing protein [Lewinellaceae bacterium]|nr:DUF3352 domain-containing protein [Lewinellaceae bacterium]